MYPKPAETSSTSRPVHLCYLYFSDQFRKQTATAKSHVFSIDLTKGQILLQLLPRSTLSPTWSESINEQKSEERRKAKQSSHTYNARMAHVISRQTKRRTNHTWTSAPGTGGTWRRGNVMKSAPRKLQCPVSCWCQSQCLAYNMNG